MKNYLVKQIVFENINQIEILYYLTIKKGIMNYILRSPFERKRLNIIYLPNRTPPSSYKFNIFRSFSFK